MREYSTSCHPNADSQPRRLGIAPFYATESDEIFWILGLNKGLLLRKIGGVHVVIGIVMLLLLEGTRGRFSNDEVLETPPETFNKSYVSPKDYKVFMDTEAANFLFSLQDMIV